MNRGFSILALLALVLVVFSANAHAVPPGYTQVRVIPAARHDVSRPLRDLRWALPPIVQRIVGGEHYSRQKLRELIRKLARSGYLAAPGSHAVIPFGSPTRKTSSPIRVRDPVIQRNFPKGQPGSFADPLISFDGLGDSTGFTVHYAPPDANIAVGMRYIVETVNLSFAVYNKSDGSLVMGPVDIHNLWSNFTGRCAGSIFDNTTYSAPVVIYDQLAQRWIVSIGFGGSSTNDPSAYCVAISKTSDPTGEYYRYQFNIFPNQSVLRPSSAKMGMWPDAYYAAFNLYKYPAGTFGGEAFIAIDRNALLHGLDADIVEIQVRAVPEVTAYSVLPATLEGFTPPPAGAPGLFASYVSPNLFPGDPYALDLWKMHVDWANPSDSTLDGPASITLPPFNDLLCDGAPACIPQPAPGDPLQSVSDRLMYPLAYRNFGDHEALVVNHTVAAGSRGALPAGIRWYEFDTSAPGAGDWSLAQSGTFAPANGANRWMGSIAMDHDGDMALGYSLAGPNLNPSVAYTGRLAGDPKGVMTQGETRLVTGGGVQLATKNRWGNYSSMVVDPADDCTFWYAQEYYAVSGPFSWSTRLGAFKYDNCAPVSEGILQGTVTNSSSGKPLAGVTIRLAPGDIQTRTDQSGHYRMKVPAGSYTETAALYPYAITTVSSTVSAGQTGTQNFALSLASKFQLSGRVTDGSGHGYGLPALIDVATSNLGQVAVATAHVDKDGAYRIELPAGFKYTLTVHAVTVGYKPMQARLILSKDKVKNFALPIETACSAPGYSFVQGGFGEDFDGTWLPADWSVTNDAAGSPVAWNTMTHWDDENYTGGDGGAATVDSNKAGSYRFDTSLVTPPIAVSDLPAEPVLDFRLNYHHFGDEALDLDMSIDGGSWTTVRYWTSSHGGLYALPGVKVHVPLGAYIPQTADHVRLRWRYFTGQPGWDWYAQVDDVSIGACVPVSGGLITGQVKDANTGKGIVGAVVINDEDVQVKTLAQKNGIPAGTYVMFAASGQGTLVASHPRYEHASVKFTMSNNKVLIRDFTLKAGRLTPKPDSFSIHATINGHTRKQLVIDNTGSAAAHFRIFSIDSPSPASAATPSGPYAPVPHYVSSDKRLAALNTDSKRTYSNVHQMLSVPENNNLSAGNILSSFESARPVYGLGVDHYAEVLWLGSPVRDGQNGDRKDHRVLFDGTDTGASIDVANNSVLFMADMAWDGNTGMLWQLSVDAPGGESSHIYELNSETLKPTGRSIEVPSFQSERGLAYDPVNNTWYAGDFNSGVVYHFDATGEILDSANVKLPILGLAYNSATGHLFVLTSGGVHDVYILDAKHDYVPVGSFDIPGFDSGGAGAGLGYDCNGDLWITDTADQRVIEVASGEIGWCDYRNIPWLSMTPVSGTVATGKSATVSLGLNGTGHIGFTTSSVYLLLSGNTPYASQVVPLIVHWDPQPVHLVLTGSADQAKIHKGDNVVYMLTVKNKRGKGYGTANKTMLTYVLPPGVSNVSGGGEGVNCAAPRRA